MRVALLFYLRLFKNIFGLFVDASPQKILIVWFSQSLFVVRCSNIRRCIQAAGNEFDISLQKKLLEAATYGKSSCDFYASDIFVDMCNTLRVLNMVHPLPYLTRSNPDATSSPLKYSSFFKKILTNIPLVVVCSFVVQKLAGR